MSQNKTINYILPSALLLLGLSVGYYLGSLNKTPSEQIRHVSIAQTSQETTPTMQKDNNNIPLKTEKKISANISKHQQKRYLNEGTLETVQTDKSMVEGINQLMTLANGDGEYDYTAVNKSKQALLRLAKSNPSALSDLLSAYAENLNNDMIQNQLFQIVSQVKTPQVQALATDLASSNDRTESIAGFDLLGALDIPTQEGLELTTSTLRASPEDKELVLSAMHALPKLTLSSEKNGEVVALLSDLANSDNEAIRSESLLTIASWAKTEEELKSVISALDSETPDDKISAAMALEHSSVVGDQIKSALLNKISLETELWEVRAMSANALNRFDLSESEFSTLQTFRKEQVGGVEH